MSPSPETLPRERMPLPGAQGLPVMGDVLALVTSTDPWGRAAVAGARLARHVGGTLTGCFIDPALLALGLAEAEPTVLSLLYERPGVLRANAAADFATFARSHGVPEAAWVVAESGVARVLRRLGAWHDLAVLECDMVGHEGLFEVLGEALLACHMPCLVLPPGSGAELAFERIAIGWNGSLQAARAIHAALPLLARASDVRVIDGVSDREEADDGVPSFEPRSYLARHGIAARLHTIDVDPQAAGATLLEEAHRMQADLLVMGAYGHSRLRERIFGGATRHLLAHADVPLLMQH